MPCCHDLIRPLKVCKPCHASQTLPIADTVSKIYAELEEILEEIQSSHSEHEIKPHELGTSTKWRVAEDTMVFQRKIFFFPRFRIKTDILFY